MRLRRLHIRFHRRLAAAAVVALLAIAIALAVVPLPGAAASIGDTSDILLRNLITAGVLAALAYLWYYAWVSDRTTQKLLEAARKAPEHLFLHRRELGAARVIGRDRLVDELRTNLAPEFNTGPQIVVGDTGAGKSSLLLALAIRLAEEEVLPIVVNLRDSGNGSGSLDFRELARERFRELVDPHVKTEADADKLWGWMCRQKQVAILVDDLDRYPGAISNDFKGKVRVALDAARRRQLPVVVTTRSPGLPLDLRDPPIDLAQRPLVIEDDSGYQRIVEDAGKRGVEPRELVEANIAAGNLLENAFYVDLVGRLLRADALEPPGETKGKHAVRLELLDAWRKVLRGDGQVSEEALEHREALLEQVEELALAWLDPELEGDAEADRSAARAGERFDLLYLDDQVVPQFRNEVLHAYFASRAIDPTASGWLETLERSSDSARVQLALVFAAAREDGENVVFCRRACEKLLEGRGDADSDQRLLRAAAAAETARAGGFHGLDGEIAQFCMNARTEAGPVAKRAALDQIALLGGETAIEALWAFGRDADYDTRWEAVKKLARRCTSEETEDGQTHREPFGADAYEVLSTEVRTALRVARVAPGKNLDDWDEKIVALKQLAWMLPPLRSQATDPKLRKEVDGQLKELVQLEKEGVTEQRGLEASIAQGFKAAALLAPKQPIARDAEERLRDARFWYSQLNLIHGIALQMAAQGEYRKKHLKELVSATCDGPPHPLLKQATRLCVEALKPPLRERLKKGEEVSEGQEKASERLKRMKRVVWDDEGAVASGRAVDLTPPATRLIGEITVLLNLNETGNQEQRERFGTDDRLPYCLQKSRDRSEFYEGCHDSCKFQLCPFHPVRDRPSAHRELSSSFCREQSRNASKGIAMRWKSRARKRGLAEFWERLERQARF